MCRAVSQSSVKTNQTEFPVGQPSGTQPPIDTTNLPPGQKVLPDAVTGRDGSQLEAAKQLSSLGGASSTDRLLGLDLRPTMTGALTAPPGNSEFLRHLSPQTRRTIMRKMLNKQRERMRRLARFLRERHDESAGGGSGDNNADEDRESFLEVISEPLELDRYANYARHRRTRQSGANARHSGRNADDAGLHHQPNRNFFARVNNSGLRTENSGL